MTISLIEKDKQIKEFTQTQMRIFWLPDEPKVEKDIQDILVNMTEAEKHGVITTLKLFSLYEFAASEEYWATRFKQIYPNSIEHLEMAATFSMFEIAIHLQFYKKLNELLHLNTDEFFNSYVNDPTLKSRMDFIGEIVNSPNDLYSIAAFSMIEGAILYSSFAFLKHFQSKGKNKLLNVVRGINFSVKDENLHSIAGAYCFKDLKAKAKLSHYEDEKLAETIYEAGRKLYEHECRIIEMIFEKGKIDGITEKQMRHFVESRINLCLHQLGYKNLFNVEYNPIADWFYDGINGYQYNDFFSGLGSQYSRDWTESEFTW